MDVQEQVERVEQAQELHLAMRKLTEAQRQVLSLRFGAQMTSEEVSKVLGKKTGAVRELQSSAIKNLRKMMTQRSGAIESKAVQED
jgi:RNA polymerase sigma-70 factor (ECF subfamily)